MDSDTQVISKYTSRQRELVARDLHELGNKLDVKRQAAHVKEGVAEAAHHKINSIKEKVPMYSSSNPVLRSAARHPIAAAAFLWGGTHLVRALRSESSPATLGYGYTKGYGQGQGYSYDSSPSIKERAHGAREGVSSGVSSAIDSVRDTASSATDSAQGAASQVASTARDVGDDISAKASEVANRAGDLVDSAREALPTDRQQIQQVAQSNWQLLGVGAFALGGALGFFTPNTRFEDQQLTPVKDELLDTARDKLEDVKEAATDTAQEAAQSLKESVQETAQEAKESFQDHLEGDDPAATPTSLKPTTTMTPGSPNAAVKSSVASNKSTSGF